MEYPEKTAGYNMVNNVPVFNEDNTLAEIEEALEDAAHQFTTLDYIYLTEENNTLVGVISIKNLMSSGDKSLKASDIMIRDLVTTDVTNDQENVVYLALSHGLKSIPVVNEEKGFMGVVPYDTILQIFNHEVQSDVFNFGGIFHRVGDEYTTIHSSALHMIRSRLPWLIIGVIGGTLAASLIAQFEELLSSFIALASFIPVMVYMSDAAGAQTEALIIRSMALESHLNVRKYLAREVVVAITLAAVSGLFAAFLAYMTRQSLILGVIIFLALFLSIIASVTINTFAPLILKKFNYDPALATGPLATIFSDIATLAIYLAVAMTLLRGV
ncbi:magnesium transporter [Methanobacterium formicicum]|uniref:Divalent cation transporter mgtE family n=1 Tax=Methanobacterium formicicum TaxID=2162 RepID=A0A089ZV89_METFO|nr:magnesium transporter [Methanobacterium formicicum]AIS32014.1 divalent cation transporter mgtE family [Methanobacterium formicicum]CEL24754.1 Mg2+ transporter [Methanobacterium formicicum]